MGLVPATYLYLMGCRYHKPFKGLIVGVSKTNNFGIDIRLSKNLDQVPLELFEKSKISKLKSFSLLKSLISKLIIINLLKGPKKKVRCFKSEANQI